VDATKVYKALLDFARSVEIELSIPGVKVTAPLPIPNTDRNWTAFDDIVARIAKMRGRTSDVLVLTAHNLDEIVDVDRIALDHECTAKGKPVHTPGGSGANTAFMLAATGAKIRVAGIVGDDAQGGQIIASLESAGIDTSLIIRKANAATGRTEIKVANGGQRFIVVYPNVNDAYAEHANLPELAAAAASVRLVHMSSFAGKREFALQVRLAAEIQDKTVISLTPGALYSSRGADKIEPLLQNVSVLFLYQEQLRDLVYKCSPLKPADEFDTRSLLDSYFAWKTARGIDRPQIVVVKERLLGDSALLTSSFVSMGAGVDKVGYFEGSDKLKADNSFRIRDTTGAGDAAAAGAIRAILQRENAAQCAEDAFAFAGFVSTERGAREAFLKAVRQIR